MKAEITVSELYWNPSVLGFFFRRQARESFEGFLCAGATGDEAEQRRRFEWLEDMFRNVDDMEEWFYDTPLSEIREEYGCEDEEDEEDEEDCE